MRKMENRFKGLLGLTILAAFALVDLAACRPDGIELSFETIAEGHSAGYPDGRGYSGEEPDLLFITAPEEVDTPDAEVQFGSDLGEQLRAVDYSNKFVIVVFRGLMTVLSPSYTVDILQVVRTGNRVVVRTHFGAPGPQQGAFPALSSPYHIIAVPMQGMQGQEIRFVLEVDGQVVKERTHFIP